MLLEYQSNFLPPHSQLQYTKSLIIIVITFIVDCYSVPTYVKELCVALTGGSGGWSTVPYTRRLPVLSVSEHAPKSQVPSPVRAHSGGQMTDAPHIDVSLSPSLPVPLKSITYPQVIKNNNKNKRSACLFILLFI